VAFNDRRKDRIKSAFSGAKNYNRNAKIQKLVAGRLASHIARLELPTSPRVLEIGCGTGFLTTAMVEAGVRGDWLVTDLSPKMVAECQASFDDTVNLLNVQFAVLDGENETPSGGPFDLICSSLALQWFDNQIDGLKRMLGWLKPGGHLIATTLTSNTFWQWRNAHALENIECGTLQFHDVADFAALPNSKCSLYCIDEEHGDGITFLKSLKAIGATIPAAHHMPLGPARLRTVLSRFEKAGSCVTYEVTTVHLRGAGDAGQCYYFMP